MNKKTTLLLFVAALLTGCSSTSGYRSVDEQASLHDRPRYELRDSNGDPLEKVSSNTYLQVDAAARAREAAYQTAMRQQGLREYERGVADTLEEFKGRRDAQEGFIWQPQIVDEVWVPGQVINGAYVPGHYEKVIVRPGGWIERNSIGLPEKDRP